MQLPRVGWFEHISRLSTMLTLAIPSITAGRGKDTELLSCLYYGSADYSFALFVLILLSSFYVDDGNI